MNEETKTPDTPDTPDMAHRLREYINATGLAGSQEAVNNPETEWHQMIKWSRTKSHEGCQLTIFGLSDYTSLLVYVDDTDEERTVYSTFCVQEDPLKDRVMPMMTFLMNCTQAQMPLTIREAAFVMSMEQAGNVSYRFEGAEKEPVTPPDIKLN